MASTRHALRGGDIVLRLSERGKQHVLFEASKKTFGNVPTYFAEGIRDGKGIGRGVEEIPAEMLEYYNYMHDTWVPLVRN